MGRYVWGSQGFSYKYVFADQPSNLGQLAQWAGLALPEETISLFTQFLLPHMPEHEERYELVDGVGHLTCVYQTAVPPFGLIDDVEDAIYNVCERWEQVIRDIDATLPGPALIPDLGGGGRFVLRREDWGRLAERIGAGADPEDPPSLESAAQQAYDSKRDDYLPFMAAHALSHAVGHDLPVLELVDVEPRSTNLWEVAADYAGAWDPHGTWEDRAVRARLETFRGRWDQARPWLQALLEERPTAIGTAQALFSRWVWDQRWGEIHEVADRLLGAGPDDVARGELLRWRGEAAWELGRMDQAKDDAVAAAAVGRSELLAALSR